MIGWDYIPTVNFPVPDLPLQKIPTASRFHPWACDSVASVRTRTRRIYDTN